MRHNQSSSHSASDLSSQPGTDTFEHRRFDDETFNNGVLFNSAWAKQGQMMPSPQTNEAVRTSLMSIFDEFADVITSEFKLMSQKDIQNPDYFKQ